MTLEQEERLRLRARAQALKPAVQVGKAGLTGGTLQEVVRQLEDHRLVKVKLLPSAREGDTSQSLAEALAEACGAELVEVRGHTAVLWKGKAQRRGP